MDPSRTSTDDLLEALPAAVEGADLESRRALRITLPLRHHIRLHSIRVLEGVSISRTIEAALDRHFATRPEPGASARR